MKSLKKLWRKVLHKHETVAAPAVATLDEMRTVAEEELVKQRAGLKREKKQRRIVQAELDRMILAATRDVLRKKAGE